ncbi:MAG: GNAT family N-acetyltransferase [Geobacter sp.]|nr:GNAT family N-acetyltransferase [Geobacter sp.]
MIVKRADVADAEDILAVQRLAFRSEAEAYQDFTIPPMNQTLAELKSDFGNHLFLKAVIDARIVGSVRGHLHNGSCHIGRLVVHPRFQGVGIGTLLMASIEMAFPGVQRFELFTGHRSERNIRLYEKLGYRIFRTEAVGAGLSLAFMEKRLCDK